MDIGKMVNLALIPTGALVALGIVQSVIGLIPGVGPYVGCITGPIGLVITMIVLGWTGYNAVKAGGLGVAEAAGTGAIAGALSSLINGIIGLVLLTLGFAGAALGGDGANAAFGTEVGVAIGLFVLVSATALGLVMGAVLGAIGGFIANRK